MIKLAPAGQKDAVEMRKVYAGFVAEQIADKSSIIALEADLMSSMAMAITAEPICRLKIWGLCAAWRIRSCWK